MTDYMTDYAKKVASTIRDLRPRWVDYPSGPDDMDDTRSKIGVVTREQFERDLEQWQKMARMMRGAMFQLSAGETGCGTYGTPTHARNYARAFNTAIGYSIG